MNRKDGDRDLHLATETLQGVMICSSVAAESSTYTSWAQVPAVDLVSTSTTGDGALAISLTVLFSTTALPLRSPARPFESMDTTFRASGRRLPVPEGVEQAPETPIWVWEEKKTSNFEEIREINKNWKEPRYKSMTGKVIKAMDSNCNTMKVVLFKDIMAKSDCGKEEEMTGLFK